MRRLSRRKWVAGISGTALASTGVALYNAFPRFWNQYVREWDRPILLPAGSPDPSVWPDRGLHVTWLGHATVLLQFDGFRILTDPVFSERAGLNVGPVTLGVKRLFEPAVPLRRLPKPDLILLSHAHMDHFDVPSLRLLEDKRTPVITAWSTSDLLRVNRYQRVRELRWGGSARIGPAAVRAFEVKHWGARMRTDVHRGYNGYVIEAGRYRVIFGGDTADTHLFASLKSSRPFDLALMPIGAYNPWARYHCNPEQAWRMGNEAGAERFVPIHHQTFSLGAEPVFEPIERFRSTAGHHQNRIAIDAIGGEFHLV